MNITIIGAGNMGHAIGTRIIAGKHTLTILDKDPNKAQELADKLRVTVEEAPSGDIVILALPYSSIPEALTTYREQLAGKILVDISNPVNFETFELLPPPGSSGAEEIAQDLPDGARLVKAFNTTFAGTLVKGEVDGKKLDVFIASDNKEAAEHIVQLANDGGLRGLYVGPLKHARALEGMNLIHMMLQEQLGTSWQSALKILP